MFKSLDFKIYSTQNKKQLLTFIPIKKDLGSSNIAYVSIFKRL